MNKPSFEQMREAMIDSQLRTTGVSDPRVVEAIRATPRELFVPAERAMLAYVDQNQPIAPGRYLMEPMVFGRLLDAAMIGPDMRVLVVGAGTGYAAAVIARLAREVVAVEEDTELAAKARANLATLRLANLQVVEGLLAAGWPAEAPYDAVFFDGMIETVPDALLGQLREGGQVIGVIVDAAGVGRGVVGVVAGGVLGTNAFMEAAVARLPGFERPKRFQF